MSGMMGVSMSVCVRKLVGMCVCVFVGVCGNGDKYSKGSRMARRRWKREAAVPSGVENLVPREEIQ